MPQGEKSGDEPIGEAFDTRPNRLHANAFQMADADLHRRNALEIQRAVLEAGLARRQHVQPALHGGEIYRAARKPRTPQAGQRRVADQQTADTGGIAEHLIEGDRHKVGCHAAQVKAIRRHVCRRVEEHVPAALAGRLDERKRMLHAGEVRLRGEGEQVGVRAIGFVEERGQLRLVGAQFRHRQGGVVHECALRAREFADPVYGIVIVPHQEIPPARGEGIGLANQFQRS